MTNGIFNWTKLIQIDIILNLLQSFTTTLMHIVTISVRIFEGEVLDPGTQQNYLALTPGIRMSILFRDYLMIMLDKSKEVAT